MSAPVVRCWKCGTERWRGVGPCGTCRSPAEEPANDLGWWTISGGDLLAMLRRARAGEDPAVLYAEAYANSEHEWPAEDET